MNRRRRCVAEILECRVMLTGTLTEFPSDVIPTPDGTTPDTAHTMLLLSDGSVLFDTGNLNANWYELKPNPQGDYLALPEGSRPAGYIAPTITAVAQSDFGRFGYASDVLPDGRVLVAGGEHNQLIPGGVSGFYPDNEAEIFDPTANGGLGGWTRKDDYFNVNAEAAYSGYAPYYLADAASEVISPDGTVLVGDQISTQMQTFHPNAPAKGDPTDQTTVSQQWTYTFGMVKPETNSEETWVKLPGNEGILTCALQSDGTTQVFERFVNGQWYVDAPDSSGNRPALDLWNTTDTEIGPALLLPSGQVLFIGSTGNTALYTPPTTPSGEGTWVTGPGNSPDFRTDSATHALNTVGITYGTGNLDDFPAALEPNGKVLFIADYNNDSDTQNISELLEWDGNINHAPSPVSVPNGASFAQITQGINTVYPAQNDYCMLELPNGQTLISNRLSGQLFVYQPDLSTSSFLTPQATSIQYNGVDFGGSEFTMTGTNLNGLSEGTSFGDDLQNATNYPIVELTGTDGVVHFARTKNWSSVGVQTGNSTPVTAQFSLPSGLTDGSYLLSISASGISTMNAPQSSPTQPQRNILFIQMGSTTTDATLVRDGDYVDLTANGSTTSYLRASFDGIVVYGVSGNCTFTVDMSNGNPLPQGTNGGISFQGTASGNTVKFAMGNGTAGDAV